ncbi:MAG: hypothetical protein E7172_00670 [Firmicutes bacterium]|nr:hypothetical protein [Bacillota bacterium]
MYLTIGTDEIKKEYFLKIKNHDNKPSGGLWLTKYDPNIPNYNEWIDYLIEHPHLLYYKNLQLNDLKASVVNLKENATIFQLNSLDQYQLLLNLYFTKNGFIDYEKLSQDYDGIFIQPLFSIGTDIPNLYKIFGVNTLIIFNYDCIKNYQKAHIIFKKNELIEYEISVLNELLYVSNINQDFLDLLNMLKNELPNKNQYELYQYIKQRLEELNIEKNDQMNLIRVLLH